MGVAFCHMLDVDVMKRVDYFDSIILIIAQFSFVYTIAANKISI